MQQAERAGSTVGTIESGGNFGNATGQCAAFLTGFPRQELQKPIEFAHESASALETTLMSMFYLAEYASEEAERAKPENGLFAAQRAGGILSHLQALAHLAMEERSRLVAHLDTGDEVITAHTVYRSAAA